MIEVKDIKYDLIGFVPHLGKSVKSGHYVKCYKSNNDWMVINDSNIYKLDDDSLRDKSYMCCFKRVDGITFGPLPTSKYVKTTRNNKLVLTNEQQNDYNKIRQRYAHLVDGPNQITQGLFNDTDIDTIIESITSSNKGTNKSKQHTSATKYEQQKQITRFIKSKFEIGQEITDFDKVFDMKLTYNILPKLFQLIGDPFIDGLVVYLSKLIFENQEQFKLFANEFISIKSVQPKAEQCLFVRLNDDHAKVNKQLFT